MSAQTLTRPSVRDGEFHHLCPKCGESYATGMEHVDPKILAMHMSDHRPYCPAVAVDVPWVFNDGGRELAGFQGSAGDCVTRAIAIAVGLDYRQVYDELAKRNAAKGGKRSARNGMPTKIATAFLAEHGWAWVPTMTIGSGTTVHLRPDELPGGPVIVRLSKHVCAVLDGVVNDTYDPSRGGTRAVYGYWIPAP